MGKSPALEVAAYRVRNQCNLFNVIKIITEREN